MSDAADVPLWVTVVGALLAGGTIVRAGVHGWVALLGGDALDEDVDPTVHRNDLTVASPVEGLRGHRLDPTARGVTALLGIGGWMLFAPLSHVGAHPVAASWLALQCAFCVADPLAYLGKRVAKQRQQIEMNS